MQVVPRPERANGPSPVPKIDSRDAMRQVPCQAAEDTAGLIKEQWA